MQIPAATRGYSDYILYPNLTGTAVQGATPTESYGNFGLGETSAQAYLSANRTCEMGLRQATGHPYESFVFLLEN